MSTVTEECISQVRPGTLLIGSGDVFADTKESKKAWKCSLLKVFLLHISIAGEMDEVSTASGAMDEPMQRLDWNVSFNLPVTPLRNGHMGHFLGTRHLEP